MYEKLQNAKPTVSSNDWNAHTQKYQQLKRNISGMRYRSPNKAGALFPTFNTNNLASILQRDKSVPRKRPYESLQEQQTGKERLRQMRCSVDTSGLSKNTQNSHPLVDIVS